MPYLHEQLAKQRALAEAPTLGNLHPDARAQAIARAGIAEAEAMRKRMDFLHSSSSVDRDGYEWGIFRVKWENGRAVDVQRVRADHADLDAAVAGVQGTRPFTGALNDVPATLTHDEGAYAQCGDCGRYTLDPTALCARGMPTCECGSTSGWSGSFKRPGPEAKWSGRAPGVALPATGWKADKLGSSLAWPADTSTDADGVDVPAPARQSSNQRDEKE